MSKIEDLKIPRSWATPNALTLGILKDASNDGSEWIAASKEYIDSFRLPAKANLIDYSTLELTRAEAGLEKLERERKVLGDRTIGDGIDTQRSLLERLLKEIYAYSSVVVQETATTIRDARAAQLDASTAIARKADAREDKKLFYQQAQFWTGLLSGGMGGAALGWFLRGCSPAP